MLSRDVPLADSEGEVHQVPEVAPAESGDPHLVARQRGDPTLSPIMGYLKDGTLPDEESGPTPSP